MTAAYFFVEQIKASAAPYDGALHVDACWCSILYWRSLWWSSAGWCSSVLVQHVYGAALCDRTIPGGAAYYGGGI